MSEFTLPEEKPKAILFIECTEEGFQVTEEAKQILMKYSNKHLGLISIVGKYRTGKSYFINKILLEKTNQDGFKVGPTINPCTKGLWMWTETIKSQNPETPDLEFLVVDCEGFGGCDEDSNHDARIFLLAILLSSFFIYNTQGNIDENSLETLSTVISLAKDVKLKHGANSESDMETLQNSFPSLLWVVRDFSLKLIDQNNNDMTPKQYLEKALLPIKGNSDSIEKKNTIRRLVKHFFVEKDLVTLVRPTELESDLQRLDKTDKYLRKEFIEQCNGAQRKILRKAKAKIVNNLTFNGEMILSLAMAYTKSINSGKTPVIHNALTYVCNSQIENATKLALKEVDKLIQTQSSEMSKPDSSWKKDIKTAC